MDTQVDDSVLVDFAVYAPDAGGGPDRRVGDSVLGVPWPGHALGLAQYLPDGFVMPAGAWIAYKPNGG